MRSQQVILAAVFYLPRLVNIQQSSTNAVYIAVAGVDNTMVNQQPALIGFNGDGAGANFHALPCRFIAFYSTHHKAVASPVNHIFALADKNIAEGGMPGIARAAHHHVAPLNLAREKDTVTVVRQEGIFQLVECLEVIRPRNADGGSVVAVAPGHIVFAVHIAYTGVIAVFTGCDLRVVPYQMNRGILNIPVQTVLAEACENIHADGQAVAAEYAGKAILERHNGAVEHAVGTGVAVTTDDGVCIIAPERGAGVCRRFLPRNIGQCAADDFSHT